MTDSGSTFLMENYFRKLLWIKKSVREYFLVVRTLRIHCKKYKFHLVRELRSHMLLRAAKIK